MTRHSLRFARIALLLCAGPALAQAPPGSDRVTPNFRETDIAAIAEYVQEVTGVTIILDARVRGNVNLVNSRSMTPQEFYEAFLSLLAVNNFAAVRQGPNLVKIIPDANVRTTPGNDVPAVVNPNSDEIVTTTIDLKNVGAAEMTPVLRQLVAQYGNLVVVPGTNSLLITDRSANVARIQKIVARVDRSSSAEVEVVRLENASAGEVVRVLTALVPAPAAGATATGLAPRFVADDRTNSIMVSGDPSARLRVVTLIAHLDTPLDDGGGTEVMYLRYLDAETLSTSLKEQVTGIAAAASGGGAGAGAGANAVAQAIDRSTTIWANKQTNALIVTAPPKMMRQLRSIVDKLDIPRAQVHVEAIIADVSTAKAADLGVNWAVFSNEDGTSTPAGGFISPVGGANNNPVSIVDLTRAVLDPASATIVPFGATFALGRLRDNGLNVGAMIRALRSDSNTNVIATPSLTVADNEEATIEDGQEVPFLTGQYTNTGGGGNNNGVNPFTTVQRQQVGTTLTVTPKLNGDNAMTLTIELESSELAGAVGDVGSQITNVRRFKSTVLVEDGQTIVIGGQIRNSKLTGQNRVPFLSRIPLIGEAFKVRSGRRNEQIMMVFIQPKILTDTLQATIETNQKYRMIRDAQQRQSERGELLPILPGDRPPLLPPPQDPPGPPASSGTAPGAGAPAGPASTP